MRSLQNKSMMQRILIIPFLLFFLLIPGYAQAWGVGEKDVKNIRNDIQIIYEKLDAFQKKSLKKDEVLLRNQASANSDITAMRDDLQHILSKLDELTQFLGMQMDKQARLTTEVQDKLSAFGRDISKRLGEMKEGSITGFEQMKADNDSRVASLEEKINALVDTLSASLEEQKTRRDALEGGLKGSAEKIAELVNISKDSLQELSKRPGAQAAEVHKELKGINQRIKGLASILKSALQSNSKTLKRYTASIKKLIDSINSQSAASVGQKKKP